MRGGCTFVTEVNGFVHSEWESLQMVQTAGILFWLIIIPYCIGLVPVSFLAEEKRNPGIVFLAGYFTMWALFGLVTIPVVLFVRYDNFILASNCFMALGIVCAAAGVWLTYRRRRFGRQGQRMSIKDCIREMSLAERIEWILFLLLLGFQLYKAAAYASFDGDDAYYVAASLIAQQADTMYTILPLTGRHTGLDIRHAMAVFPMWIAFAAKKSHIHATILSHTILPFVLIPLTYLVYYEIGRILFGRRGEGQQAKESDQPDQGQQWKTCRENLPLFMILMAVLQIFGNVSIYTNETFFLTRTWQGKAVAGSLVIPALLWLFLLLDNGRDRREAGRGRTDAGQKRTGAGPGVWFLLVCVNITAGICSSIAVFLVFILMAVSAVCLAFVERDLKVVIKMGAVCIPNAFYVLAYLVVGYSYLLQ